MRVLILEGRAGAAGETITRLEQAGHSVSRCHDPNAAVFPCNGMVDGNQCPLDEDQVDVAVVVRDQGNPEPTASEDGVGCALRRHIPLVMVGQADSSPYWDHAVAFAPGPETAVAAVADAASAPLPKHDAAAEGALRDVLDRHGFPEVTASATVRRMGRDLMVTLRPGAALDKNVAEMASVRAVGAVRGVDPWAAKIDVTIET